MSTHNKNWTAYMEQFVCRY